jgi:hypothetical protein
VRRRSQRCDPVGTERVGVRATGTVDRAAYGMTWNVPVVDGALALAEQVKITSSRSATRPPSTSRPRPPHARL